MSWHGIRGHDRVVEQFRRCIQQRRLATTFLFVGRDGIGKRTFALKLAQAILCSRATESELDPCGECAECQQVGSDTHPDLQLIRKPADRAYIPVEAFIGDRDHRMRTGLCHFISLTPSGGKRRIAIIDDADWLNQEGANSLLKTLEEPSPGAVIILVSTSLQRQLPTIRSRSQVIHFQPLPDESVASCLLDQGLAESQEEADVMAGRAGGSVAAAVQLADSATVEFRQQLWSALAQPQLDRAGVAEIVNAFADQGGKETAAKRANLRLAIHSAIDFYRSVARALQGLEFAADPELQVGVATVVQRGPLSAEVTASQVERCVAAIGQVNANANLGMLIDAWVCDLAVMTRTQRPVISSNV